MNREEEMLVKIGSQPLSKPPKSVIKEPRRRPDPQLTLWLRSRQTFVYHCCEAVAQRGWHGCQDLINEFQRTLEEVYDTPSVELVNVYRRNNTKDDGIFIIAIFKIGPANSGFDYIERVRPGAIRAWWTRVRKVLPWAPVEKTKVF